MQYNLVFKKQQMLSLALHKLGHRLPITKGDCKTTDVFFVFSMNVDKDGYNMDKITNSMIPGLRKVIMFLNTLLTLEKPSSVKMETANLIIQSYLNMAKVNWGLMFNKVINKLVEKIYAGRGCPLTPYIMHIYFQEQYLTKEELKLYKQKSNL